MILIADSGSTKCDWVVVDESGEKQLTIQTQGLNPFFHDAEYIYNAVSSQAELAAQASRIQEVHYYGTGCSSDANKAIVANALDRIFTQAHILVEHDMMAAARATYDGESCICCILGTGSNAAFFDGEEIHAVNAGIGYVLGDEASGTYFGKQLIADHLYGLLPDELEQAFREAYPMDRDAILERVYWKPHANYFLAGFTRFLGEHSEHEYVRKMVREGFLRFLQLHVCCFESYRTAPTHFIGSVAYYFKDILEDAAKEVGANLGTVIRSPIDNLVEFHIT